MNMTEYYINEAILAFPGRITQDSTVNMIRLSDPDAALVISRGLMQEGDELVTQIDQQMKKLKTQVKELRYSPMQPVKLGINEQVEGQEIQNQFLRGHEQIYQYQVAFVLPGNQVMMALTYARTVPLTETDAVRWAEIKKNLRFRLTNKSGAAEE